MNSGILFALMLAGCRDAHPCPTEADRFDPEVDSGDSFVDAPSATDVEDAACAGGMTWGDWSAIAENSPGYEPVLAICAYWCVEAYVGRSACVLRATVEEWRDLDCPGCRIVDVDGASYPTINVECGP